MKDYPAKTKALMKTLRKTIREIAPDATEAISYGIPTFKLNGNLVHFGGYEHHIGFYPGAAPIAAFKKELSKYTVSKGTVQFPLDKPIPVTLVKKMVRYCVKRNLAKKK